MADTPFTKKLSKLNNFNLKASLVQLVERRSPKPDVEGSSPSGRVFKLNRGKIMANQTKNQVNKNIKEDFIAYLKSVKLEWGKISWPQKQQVFVETLYVIVVTFVFTITILLMDSIFSGVLKLLHLS